MKKFTLLLMLWLFTSIALPVNAQIINANPDPNGEPWIVGGYEITPEVQAMYDSLSKLTLTDKALSISLPYKWDNSDGSTNPYFRTIFSQGSDGSCAQASGVGYIFTYMINRERGLPSIDSVNLYPTHYTWNYLNKGGNNGSNTLSGWRIIQDSGVPNIQTYGGMSMFPTDPEKRRKVWMTGYDKYQSALENRVIIDAYTINCKEPDGVETLKHYIHNLAEGDTVKGGGIVGFGVSWGDVQYEVIPQSSEEAGKKIVKSWGGGSGHAMTIVGYNDSIKYDFYGEWEYGAVKVANSHGVNYPTPLDSGFVYMPYRLLYHGVSDGIVGISGRQVRAIKVKETYAPKVTVKAKISHPSRNKINIRAGIAEDASYETPTITQTYNLSYMMPQS